MLTYTATSVYKDVQLFKDIMTFITKVKTPTTEADYLMSFALVAYKVLLVRYTEDVSSVKMVVYKQTDTAKATPYPAFVLGNNVTVFSTIDVAATYLIQGSQ